MTTAHTQSKAQIIATIGPASSERDVLRDMIRHQADAIRFNFSWGSLEERIRQIQLIRGLEKECGRRIVLIQDLPGPRVQTGASHSYDRGIASALTPKDKEYIAFGALHGVDWTAVSFVGTPADIEECREVIRASSGRQRIIAKIERALALESLDEIIAAADAVMIARGDLGSEIPLERMPFVQNDIIQACKRQSKPVIVATQMLLSMTDNATPTRAEVTDVAHAIIEGADAVMLSEETARGNYPVEAVMMMEKIVVEAEKHRAGGLHFNLL